MDKMLACPTFAGYYAGNTKRALAKATVAAIRLVFAVYDHQQQIQSALLY
jgi:hypothetical protein